MSDVPRNPGVNILVIGMLITFCMFVGGNAQAEASAPPSVALAVTCLITMGVTIFVASVVGAYYAGKRKR